MSWSQRRRANYIFGIILFIVIFIILPIAYFSYDKPTCFDNKQNQNEAGVDCGGPCSILCREYFDIKVKWTSSARTTSSGLYNLIAYLENPNIDAGADNLNYNFKVYDRDGILIAQRSGESVVPANKSFVVFEDSVDLKDKIPKKITFDILNKLDWRDTKARESDLFTVSKSISGEEEKPRIEATIENRSLDIIKKIEFTVIAYDYLDNAVAFSRTRLDKIDGKSMQNIIFTWPEAFSSGITKTEILSKVLE